VLAKQLAEEKRKEAELEKNLANTKAELLKDEASLAEDKKVFVSKDVEIAHLTKALADVQRDHAPCPGSLGVILECVVLDCMSNWSFGYFVGHHLAVCHFGGLFDKHAAGIRMFNTLPGTCAYMFLSPAPPYESEVSLRIDLLSTTFIFSAMVVQGSLCPGYVLLRGTRGILSNLLPGYIEFWM